MIIEVVVAVQVMVQVEIIDRIHIKLSEIFELPYSDHIFKIKGLTFGLSEYFIVAAFILLLFIYLFCIATLKPLLFHMFLSYCYKVEKN